MTYWWDTAPPGTPSHGDHFFRDVSAMSDASVPFHVSPGNGDSGGNFSEYVCASATTGLTLTLTLHANNLPTTDRWEGRGRALVR